MIEIKSNIILGLVIILFSILAYTQTLDLPATAALFPRLVLYGIGISGMLLIIDTVVKSKKGKHEKTELNMNVFIFQVIIPSFALIITFLLIPYLGFYLSAFLLILFAFFFQTYRADRIKMNRKHFLKGLIVAISIIAILYVIFNLFLQLPTPTGSLFL